MANRCSLYALEFVPATLEDMGKKPFLLSEYTYDIPLVFRILVSPSPRVCPSLDWPDQGEVAILGELPQGRERLFSFLAELDHPIAQPLIEEAREFLLRPELQLPYALLEPYDIFQMGCPDPIWQIQELLESMEYVVEELTEKRTAVLASLSAPSPSTPKFRWPWQKPPKPVDPLQPLYELGLGSWG